MEPIQLFYHDEDNHEIIRYLFGYEHEKNDHFSFCQIEDTLKELESILSVTFQKQTVDIVRFAYQGKNYLCLSIFLIRNGIEANLQLEIPVEDERYVCTVKTWYSGKVFTLNISEPQAFKTKEKKCQ